MSITDSQIQETSGFTLVTGGTGKTGKRITEQLKRLNVPVRIGSRSTLPRFDWTQEASWDACLEGVEKVYISYTPDLAVPGAKDTIEEFVTAAEKHGVKKVVILSGRGETEAQACERIVQNSGLRWTVVRSSWFNQNFSEGAFLDMIRAGRVYLPVGKVAEPFIDIDDLAEVAVAALTGSEHDDQVYEVTGPRLLTFENAVNEIAEATGRQIDFVEISHDAFVAGVAESGAPKDVVWIMDYLFSTVLDGRNASLADGVQRALGRAPKDFAAFARDIAATGMWRAVA